MPTFRQMVSVKEANESGLLRKRNVNAVGIGRKRTGGSLTDELAIVVFVDKKEDVPAKERVPATIDGVKTDVVERRIVPLQHWVRLEDLEPHVDATNYHVLRGGMSIGPCRAIFIDATDAACRGLPGPGNYLFVGTLGVPVRDRSTGDDMLLSNHHVMCVDDGWNVGDTMAQPSRVDGGNCPVDVVAELTRAALNDRVDAAVARRTARSSTCEIIDIGAVNGRANATIGMAVRKRGRTTELTHGTVDVVNLTVNVPYCDGFGTVTLTNQIGIDVDTAQSTVFGLGGDSGSVVVNDARRVVGLFFAGTPDGTYGVANHIDDVLREMDVELCTSKSLLKELKDGHKDVKELPKEVIKERIKEHIKEPKEFKEFKELPKELKDAQKEFKDLPKEIKEPKELKEFREPKQLKEPKDVKELKEFREPKQIKEHVKEFKEPKEIYEGPDKQPFEGPDKGLVEWPGMPQRPDLPLHPEAPDLHERLRHLEDAVSQLTHFIGAELRPDLRRGSLRAESDLQREADEARRAKDLQDTGKAREG